MRAEPLLLICMGVSGSGKSTVAGALAEQYNFKLLEADDFHSPENKAHMASGQGLTDAMREPWICALCEALEQQYKESRDCVIAFSGLRFAHRQRLRTLGFRQHFLLLEAPVETIGSRMQARNDHFMPASLLNSQLADFESTASESDVQNISVADSLPQTLARIETVLTPLLKHTDQQI